MKLLTKAGSIKDAIEDLKPTHIATAYVGLGWETYIEKEALQSIVLSPTFGSNAIAIKQLVRHLGIDNVHLLENLHAKFYWTQRKAVLGSANLSDNGLQGDGGLIEAGVALNDHAHLLQLKAMYDDLVSQAQSRYPTAARKYQLINALETMNQKASLGGFVRKKKGASETGMPLAEFDPLSRPRMHVVAYEDDLDLREDNIRKAIPSKTEATYEALFGDVMGFPSKDDIREGDWILCFEADLAMMRPKRKGAIEWMYVDYVVPNGSTTKPFTKVALQQRPRKAWEAPFLLTSEVKEALVSLVAKPGYEPLYYGGLKKPGLKEADALVPSFLKELKKAVSAS